MRKVWIVAADGSEARIFNVLDVNKIEEVRNLASPEARLNNIELVSDKHGTSAARGPRGFGSHAFTESDKISPKKREKLYFAEEVAHVLNEHFHQGAFERVYLIAPPTFCAFLREKVDPNVEKLIQQEIHKNVVHLRAEEIRSFLPYTL